MAIMFPMVVEFRKFHGSLEGGLHRHDVVILLGNPVVFHLLIGGMRNRDETEIGLGNVLVFNIH